MAGFERAGRVPPARIKATPPEPDTATDNVYVDHGDGQRFTYVRAGDEIPRALAHLPRRTQPVAASSRTSSNLDEVSADAGAMSKAPETAG